MTSVQYLAIQGIELSCLRTAESFSPGDYVSWLEQLHCALQVDMQERLTLLGSLQYTVADSERVCKHWDSELSSDIEGEIPYSG